MLQPVGVKGKVTRGGAEAGVAGFQGAHSKPVDRISFGSSREPRQWRPGWWHRPGRLAWLVVLAAAVVVVAVVAVVLVTTRGHARRMASVPLPSAQPLPPMLAGIPARSVRSDLFLGGESFWRVGRRPRAVLAGLLLNGLSPLLPHGHGAQVGQLAAVPGGAVALISDISTGITYGALGRVVLIPASNAPARAIARATVIAVGPGGRQVWVQTAIQSVNNGEGLPATFRSPTWAVNLAGRRVSPVLRLPLGLVGATESGPLTQNLATGQLQLWDGATGRPMHLPLPADAQFVAAGRGRVVWQSSAPSSALHVTDLRTGSDAAVPLPANWLSSSQTYPPPPASFDPSGRRLVLPLDRVDSSGNTTAEDLFIADTATGTLRMIPGKPLPLPSSSTTQADQLAGSWDSDGLLWVLAMSPYNGYYQLGFWTGAGPLHTFGPAQGSPMALSAPGSG